MFVTRAEEEKTRAIQEAISTLMKWHRAEMRDDAKEAAKEARAGFTVAVNAAVGEALSKVRSESDLLRRRDAEEAVRVA